MKDIFNFVCIFAWIAGVIGGLCAALLVKHYGLLVAVLVLGAMAFPYAYECYKKLTGK